MLELGKKCICLDDIMLDFTHKLMKTISQDTKNEVNNTSQPSVSASSASGSFIEMSKLCTRKMVTLLDSSQKNPTVPVRLGGTNSTLEYHTKNIKSRDKNVQK